MLTKEQLLKRKQGIGGSDVAAICGLSKFKTPFEVYLEKTEEDIPQDHNDYIWWGNANEPTIIKKYLDTYPDKTITYPDTIHHKNHSFLFANVDGLLSDKGILEAKNVGINSLKKWGMQYTDDIPVEYLLQVAHYAAILEAPYVHIAAYFGGADFRIYEYIPNKKIEALILEKCINFWENHVLKRIPPPATCYEDNLKLWKESVKDSSKIAPADIIASLQNLDQIKKQKKQLEQQEEDIKTRICSYLGYTEILIDDDGRSLCSWKTQNTNRLDTGLFKKNHPDLYEKYTKTLTTRVFRSRGEINVHN